MQVELKVDADAVQRQLVDGLIQSAVGEQITKAINSELQNSSWNHGTIVEQAVRSALHDQLVSLVNKILREREAELREMVVAALTPEIMSSVISVLTDRLWKELR